MDKKYDVIAIGMGPSSAFMAYELIKLKKYYLLNKAEEWKTEIVLLRNSENV